MDKQPTWAALVKSGGASVLLGYVLWGGYQFLMEWQASMFGLLQACGGPV